METANLLKDVRRAEKSVSQELEALQQECAERISETKTTVRKKVKETLEEDPQQRLVRENIEHLQLRLELLRNMRMNWKNFEKYAHERGIELRINQFSALQHLIQFLETGEGEEVSEGVDSARALMAFEVQPTGAGKTGAFAIETALLDVPTLILVPFDNLVEQTKEDLMKIGGIAEENIGLLYGGTKEFGRKVTVATYAGHAAQMRRKEEYANHIQNNVKYCICDEVHTSLGDRTQESLLSIDGMGNGELTDEETEALKSEQYVLEHLDEQVSQKALKVGFTATPKASAKHVSQYFPHFLGRVYHKDMVEAGILVPYRIVQCDGSVSEGEIGGYISQELEVKILEREKIYEKLLGEYAEALHTYQSMKKKNEYPLRGMAFCTNHAECEKFAKEAQALGLRCEIVTGREASGKKGREVINAAKEKICRGEIDIIVTVEKLCAGFNFPEINAVIWARVTSMAKTIQGIGRGGRSFKEGKMKKDCCWVFETNWALKKNAKRGKKPLRIADALAENGENPDAICAMADGTKVDYRIPLPKINDEGIVIIDSEVGVGLNAYADFIGIKSDTLKRHVIESKISSIGKAYSKTGIEVDAYRKSDIDALEAVQNALKAGENTVDKNGMGFMKGIPSVCYAYALYLGCISEAGLEAAIERANLVPLGMARMYRAPVSIYSKAEVDALPEVKIGLERGDNEVKDDGTILMNGALGVGCPTYIPAGMSKKYFMEAIQIHGVKPIGKAKSHNATVNVYLKEEIDRLARKIKLDENATVETDEGLGVGLTAYAIILGISHKTLIKIVKANSIKSLGNAISGSHEVEVYLKDAIDQIPEVKEALQRLGKGLDEKGVIILKGKEAIGARAYARHLGCGGEFLENLIKSRGIQAVSEAFSGSNKIDVYSKAEVDNIPELKDRLDVKTYPIDENGIVDWKGVAGITVNRYAKHKGTLAATLNSAIEQMGIQSLGKVKAGHSSVDVYPQNQVNELPLIKSIDFPLDDMGIVQVGEYTCVGLAKYAAASDTDYQTLVCAVESWKLQVVGWAKSGNKTVKVYKKSEVDKLF